jgi:hypothetical protein
LFKYDSGSICDRLKQRYGNYQQDWKSLFKIQEKNIQDFEFIQYIVNFIIEQAKHNIVISEVGLEFVIILTFEMICFYYSYQILFELYIVKQKIFFKKM